MMATVPGVTRRWLAVPGGIKGCQPLPAPNVDFSVSVAGGRRRSGRTTGLIPMALHANRAWVRQICGDRPFDPVTSKATKVVAESACRNSPASSSRVVSMRTSLPPTVAKQADRASAVEWAVKSVSRITCSGSPGTSIREGESYSVARARSRRRSRIYLRRRLTGTP